MERAEPNQSKEIEDATWEPVNAAGAARPAAPLYSPLVYSPGVRQDGQVLEVFGWRDDETARPWGLWGGVLALVLLAGFVASTGASGGFFALKDILIAITLIGVSVAMFRYGPRGQQRREVLTRVDMERAQLVWSSKAGAQTVLGFDEISEVVFAMIRFPVSPSHPNARIHVFTVLVRTGEREELTPVIEATPNKREAFAIAQFLSNQTRAPLTQVGEGIFGPS